MAGGGGDGGMNWEIGIDIYTLICIKWITDKSLLYKKINKVKFLKKMKMGRNSLSTAQFPNLNSIRTPFAFTYL